MGGTISFNLRSHRTIRNRQLHTSDVYHIGTHLELRLLRIWAAP